MLSAQNKTLTGKITDEEGRPLYLVSVQETNSGAMATTDSNGLYQLTLPEADKAFVKITCLLYEPESFTLKNTGSEGLAHDVVLHKLTNIIQEVEIKDQRNRLQAGGVVVNLENVDLNPSPIGGVEGFIKTLVGSKNELTSQYTVRGGNYDENLVYVNDFEIYRPFLVRSGQQEGLSFVNSDLAAGVDFSVGGFQAKYGDKMSSVLDVTYKRPKKFAGSVLLSLLGANAHLEGASKNKKFTYLVGARQKTNQYLLQSQPTKGQYNPSFTDIQVLLNYRFNEHWELEAIGNYARNRFSFVPTKSEAAFGYINEAYKLRTNYTGQEIDQFDTRFAGMALSWRPDKKTKIKLLASGFQTNERETYDIIGEYGFYSLEVDLGKSTFGQEKYSLGTGIFQDFARNYLTANVGTMALRGSHDAGKNYIQWGADFTYVSIDDQLMEWQRRDSAGFTQPFDDEEIKMARTYRGNNAVDYLRISGFLQDNILLGNTMTLNLGLRANYSFLNDEPVISPRVQYAVKPRWKHDVVFRIASGLYAQPPFYREMRNMEGVVNTGLKAQKSFHAAGGLDYNFLMWGSRIFKFTAEAYYKRLWDLVPYEYDNVRIRYYANNNGRGYAYGAEARLYGELVKDAESWVSIGYLKTENQLWDSSTNSYGEYFARPTDQRLNFGMFFSDYLPRNKNFKMYLNLIYATGLPFSPSGKGLDPNYQLRIPDYKRADIGFSALLVDGNRKNKPAYSFFSYLKSVWLSAEVFNLLAIQNTLSYQWIQDYSSNKLYAVPNRLSSRLINVKLAVKF
ncbi:MAG: carboxypeptidase-like regulatory domain-containing protein [Edaphocola sp.]